jgi:hypothetical protein
MSLTCQHGSGPPNRVICTRLTIELVSFSFRIRMALGSTIRSIERYAWSISVVFTASSFRTEGGSVIKFPSRRITRGFSVGWDSMRCGTSPVLVERCFFKSDRWRKLIRFSSESVVCDECPSEAKQQIAGGEEGIRAIDESYASRATRLRKACFRTLFGKMRPVRPCLENAK